jgi:hypothetical protein
MWSPKKSRGTGPAGAVNLIGPDDASDITKKDVEVTTRNTATMAATQRLDFICSLNGRFFISDQPGSKYG